jgi:hypothetical protein
MLKALSMVATICLPAFLVAVSLAQITGFSTDFLSVNLFLQPHPDSGATTAAAVDPGSRPLATALAILRGRASSHGLYTWVGTVSRTQVA